MNGVDNLRQALHPKILELIIFPTEKCNFRCTYCYETFEVGKMKQETVEGIKKLVEARIGKQTLDYLVLSWFGGEPTLAKEIIYELGDFGMELLNRQALKGFTGHLTTNGYLLDRELLEALVLRRQAGFQISLDGYGAGHDTTRKYASGKGTFDTIWSNLLAAHETDLEFQVTLRLHQTSENEESMRELVGQIRKHFKGDKRFSVFFKTIENLGGPNAPSIRKVDVASARPLVEEFSAALRADGFAVSAVIEGPESSRGEMLPEPATERETPASNATPPSVAQVVGGRDLSKGYSGYICYAAKPNSLIIRATGRVGKCTVLLDDVRNDIGKLNHDGTVTLDSERMNLWMRGFNTFDPMELGCPAKNLPKLESSLVRESVVSLDSLQRRPAAATTVV